MGSTLKTDAAPQPQKPRLGRAIGRVVGHAMMRGNRGDIDNTAPFIAFHVWHHGSYHTERSAEVRIDVLFPDLFGMIDDRGLVIDTSRIHEDINTTMPFEDIGNKEINAVARLNVEGSCMNMTGIRI